ncbi:MAG: hypothetical protein ABIW76_05945 [Fibrobacteria bacterium]
MLAALILAACGGTDSGDAVAPTDIRDGDLDFLTIDAMDWGPGPLGGTALIHNHGFKATCPVNSAALDDRKDSATVSLAEVDHGYAEISIWFAGRSGCREAGARLTAARADFASYGFADSTKVFTKIVYRIRGGGFDSLRVGADVTLDSASFPGLSALVKELEGNFAL